MTKSTLQFSAIDTWFFRDSRPFESTGELQSIFPPPMRTLSGAIRTWIGEQQKVDWKDFKDNPNNSLRAIIGSSKEGDLGQLSFQGVWLLKGGKRLYPMPAHLLKKVGDETLYRLKLAEQGTHCDLGKSVRLAELSSADAKGAKPLEKTWVDAETFNTILLGTTPAYDTEHFIGLDDLIGREPRVGIARNNKKRTVESGKLYQLQQVRPKADISVEVDIKGLPENCTKMTNAKVRLGGEGRVAAITHANPTQLPAPQLSDDDLAAAKGIVIYLLSPLQMEDNHSKLPNFVFNETATPNYWQGEIEGIPLKLCGAITGKSIRDGGWNLAEGKPRTDVSLVPAGSLFFCELEPQKTRNIQQVIKTLHGQQIGGKQNYGFGQIAVGLWK